VSTPLYFSRCSLSDAFILFSTTHSASPGLNPSPVSQLTIILSQNPSLQHANARQRRDSCRRLPLQAVSAPLLLLSTRLTQFAVSMARLPKVTDLTSPPWPVSLRASLPSPRACLTDPNVRSLLVQRAIAISQQFEASSRARERTMRANESLPLTAQADAAFLINLAKLGSIDAMSKVEKGQL
jgi:hypothetical protein